MIKQYYRPTTLEEALKLLSTTSGDVVPLGGGTQISHSHKENLSVVDLQNLELDKITMEGNSIHLGGTCTLNHIAEDQNLQPSLRKAASKELNFNLRQKATLAGTVVAGDGRSTLLTALLANDAIISWLPDRKTQGIGEFLLKREQPWPGKIIELLKISANVVLQFSAVGRSPADLPLICVAVAKWPSGRIRIALGGFGPAPILALDAPEIGGVDFAVKDALASSTDQWATAEYRQAAAVSLIKRMLTDQ